MDDDPRRNAPACPRVTCPAQAGDQWCYTTTGFRRHWHAARWAVAAGHPPTAEPAAGSRAGRRPTEAQHRMLSWALADKRGRVEISGYTFHGDAQRRATMLSMADPTRRWFTHVKETDHGTLYEITDDGRAAWKRYEDWMNGGRG